MCRHLSPHAFPLAFVDVMRENTVLVDVRQTPCSPPSLTLRALNVEMMENGLEIQNSSYYL